ncbi:unnamed protein product [Cladocopium goreaui]|uniref:malate dehydrogenase n=1 Tax=Cladocopium goreaui TaxID=2562237 RepID=A0A9P1FK10_9DINO|nr:unnamed protein product [Cladocopium goreaui]
MESLRQRRSKALRWRKRSVSDYSGVRRIHQILTRATLRFKADLRLWYQHVDFCLRSGSSTVLQRVLMKAVKFHPKEASLWLLAADRELRQGHVDAARKLLMRALRCLPKSVKVLSEFLRLEVGVAGQLLVAREMAQETEVKDEAKNVWAPTKLLFQKGLSKVTGQAESTAKFLLESLALNHSAASKWSSSEGFQEWSEALRRAAFERRPGLAENTEDMITWTEVSDEAAAGIWEVWWKQELACGSRWPDLVPSIASCDFAAVLLRAIQAVLPVADDAGTALATLAQADAAAADPAMALIILQELSASSARQAKGVLDSLLQRAASRHPKHLRLAMLTGDVEKVLSLLPHLSNISAQDAVPVGIRYRDGPQPDRLLRRVDFPPLPTMGASASRDSACFAGAAGALQRRSEAPISAMEPVTVTVCGAAGHIGYSLLPMIASGAIFGPSRRVCLQCLDLNLPEVMDSMRGIEMEMYDGNFPLLQKMMFTTDDAQAFKGADYAILLGAFPKQDGIDKRDVMEKNVMIFRTMGKALERHVKPECKVLVVGNPSHTNAWICAQYAPSLPKHNIFALTRLDQNRATGQIAHHFGLSVNDVRNVVVWGCHAKFPDVDHAVIKGKPFSEIPGGNRLNDLFRKEMQTRGASIVKARKASSAMSTARAIVDHLKDLHLGTRVGEFVSMGVWSDHGAYSIADSLVFSVPVVCQGGGKYHVYKGLSLSVASQEKLRQVEAEMLADRDLARQCIVSNACFLSLKRNKGAVSMEELEHVLRALEPGQDVSPVLLAVLSHAAHEGPASLQKSFQQVRKFAEKLWDVPRLRVQVLFALLRLELRTETVEVKDICKHFEDLLSTVGPSSTDATEVWLRYLDFVQGVHGTVQVPRPNDLHLRALRSVQDQEIYREKAQMILQGLEIH